VQLADRLFVNDPANPNFWWYSELLEPYTFKATNFGRAGDASADLIKGMDVYENGLVLRCERANYYVYMPSTDPTDWQTIRIKSEFGSRSPFGSFLYNNKLMFPAVANTKFAGFAALSGTTIDPEATALDKTTAGSDRKSDRIEPDMFQVSESALAKIQAITFKNKAYIAVPFGSGQTTNNRIYIADFSSSNMAKRQEIAWSPVSGLSAACFTIYDGKLYFGSSTANGFVYQLEVASTYADDGSAINSYFWTKEFSGLPGHENYEKVFRSVKLLVENVGNYFMNVTVRTNSDTGDGVTYQINTDPGSSTWNSLIWGSGVWGGGTSQEEKTLRFGALGKRIQLRFSNQNTAGQRFKVHGVNITYNIKGKR
jgi:hypothetical protein